MDTTASEECIPTISMQDFFDFLKISAQVHEQISQPNVSAATVVDSSTSNSILTSDSAANFERSPSASTMSSTTTTNSHVNLNELSLNPVINELIVKPMMTVTTNDQRAEPIDIHSVASCSGDRRDAASNQRRNSLTSRICHQSRKTRDTTAGSASATGLHPALEQKLSQVIDEGLLDSVLQYMAPPLSQPAAEKSQAATSSSSSSKPSALSMPTTVPTLTSVTTVGDTNPSKTAIGGIVDPLSMALTKAPTATRRKSIGGGSNSVSTNQPTANE